MEDWVSLHLQITSSEVTIFRSFSFSKQRMFLEHKNFGNNNAVLPADFNDELVAEIKEKRRKQEYERVSTSCGMSVIV